MRIKQPSTLADRLGAATRGCRDLPSLAEAVFTATDRQVPFGFGCFATTDPTTGAITWAVKTRSLGVGDEEFAAAEYGGSDVNSLAEIAHRQPPVGALSIDTGGRLDSCRRYREFLRPRFGFADELRLVFRSRAATWGVLALYRDADEAPFTAPEVRQAAGASELVAEAIQRCLFAAGPGSSSAGDAPPHGPAVVILDANDRVTHLTAAARWAIDELGGWEHGSLPTSLLVAATTARNGAGHPGTRARARSGCWLSLRAAALSGPAGGADVVVTIEVTPRAELSGLALAARGLSAREQDVALLVLQGADTRAIATTLHLSPHTVQDHLKSIFAKLGVTSRRELVALLVLD